VNLNEAILHFVTASQDNVVTQVQFMFLSDGEYMIIDALYMELYVLIIYICQIERWNEQRENIGFQGYL
jgi:hypothetical protein